MSLLHHHLFIILFSLIPDIRPPARRSYAPPYGLGFASPPVCGGRRHYDDTTIANGDMKCSRTQHVCAPRVDSTTLYNSKMS